MAPAGRKAIFERHRIVSPTLCRPGSFRTQVLGRGTERIACIHRRTGQWITQSLLVARFEPPSQKARVGAQSRELRERAARHARQRAPGRLKLLRRKKTARA